MWLRMARRTATCWSSEPQIMCENVRNKDSITLDGFGCTRRIEYVRFSSSQSVRLLKAEPKGGTGKPLPLHVNGMELEWDGVRRSPRTIVSARFLAGLFQTRLLSRRLTTRVKYQLSFTWQMPLQCRHLRRRLTSRVSYLLLPGRGCCSAGFLTNG